MRPRLVIAVVLLCVSVVAISDYWWPWEVVRDNRTPFSVDPKEPFRIELGRGSGLHGLNSVKITQDGRVAMCREKREREGDTDVLLWETATIQLPSDALASVLDAVERHGLMKLHRSYSARGVADGTQWVLLIRQGTHEKSVYFNNAFPDPIREFATDLDAIIIANSRDVTWRPTSIRQDEELWESIGR